MHKRIGIVETVRQYQALFSRYFSFRGKLPGQEDMLLMELFETWYEERGKMDGDSRTQLLIIARIILCKRYVKQSYPI